MFVYPDEGPACWEVRQPRLVPYSVRQIVQLIVLGLAATIIVLLCLQLGTLFVSSAPWISAAYVVVAMVNAVIVVWIEQEDLRNPKRPGPVVLHVVITDPSLQRLLQECSEEELEADAVCVSAYLRRTTGAGRLRGDKAEEAARDTIYHVKAWADARRVLEESRKVK